MSMVKAGFPRESGPIGVMLAEHEQGRQYTRAMRAAAERRARELGARTATLEVRRSNAPAIGLYRSMGYRDAGVRPRYYADDGEYALVMDKDLGPPPSPPPG